MQTTMNASAEQPASESDCQHLLKISESLLFKCTMVSNETARLSALLDNAYNALCAASADLAPAQEDNRVAIWRNSRKKRRNGSARITS